MMAASLPNFPTPEPTRQAGEIRASHQELPAPRPRRGNEAVNQPLPTDERRSRKWERVGDEHKPSEVYVG